MMDIGDRVRVLPNSYLRTEATGTVVTVSHSFGIDQQFESLATVRFDDGPVDCRPRHGIRGERCAIFDWGVFIIEIEHLTQVQTQAREGVMRVQMPPPIISAPRDRHWSERLDHRDRNAMEWAALCVLDDLAPKKA